MNFRQAVLDIPKAWAETLARAKPEYEAVARGTRWGEIPAHIVTTGPLLHIANYGVYAFETLLGWPAVVRDALDFITYGVGTLRQRSMVLLLTASGKEEELFAAAQAARARGSVVLAMSGNPYSPLAKAAHGVFLIRAGEDYQPSVKTAVCLQAGLGYLGLTLARLLKRPQAVFSALEEEFATLPDEAEKVLGHLSDAASSLADELKKRQTLQVAGEGFFEATEQYWVWLAGKLLPVHLRAMEAPADLGAAFQPKDAVLFLSGSRCRLKKRIHEQAMHAKRDGAHILAITDGNDRELAGRADLAVLLPTLHEMTGSLLAMVLLLWATCLATRDGDQRPARNSARKTK